MRTSDRGTTVWTAACLLGASCVKRQEWGAEGGEGGGFARCVSALKQYSAPSQSSREPFVPTSPPRTRGGPNLNAPNAKLLMPNMSCAWRSVR